MERAIRSNARPAPGKNVLLKLDEETNRRLIKAKDRSRRGNDSNLLIVFYVQIVPDDFVMQLHRF